MLKSMAKFKAVESKIKASYKRAINLFIALG
jgi:hypothetical protein